MLGWFKLKYSQRQVTVLTVGMPSSQSHQISRNMNADFQQAVWWPTTVLHGLWYITDTFKKRQKFTAIKRERATPLCWICCSVLWQISCHFCTSAHPAEVIQLGDCDWVSWTAGCPCGPWALPALVSCVCRQAWPANSCRLSYATTKEVKSAMTLRITGFSPANPSVIWLLTVCQ